MRTRRTTALALGALALGTSGCGTTERSGAIGSTFDEEGLVVTVQRLDTTVPAPARDVTGLSRPARGTRLVGVLVRVCSENGAAVGPYDFTLTLSQGDARLRFPQRNYRDSFETIRRDCGEGWVVFQVPRAARVERVRFGFEDTGTARRPQDAFDVRFEWTVVQSS